MHKDIKEEWFDEDQIQDAVKDLGRTISRDYKNKNLLLVGILKGCFVFMADLIRAITIPCAIDFMLVSSYGSGTKSSGAVKIIKDLDLPLENYDVLIVEDILDSGNTLNYVKDILSRRNPKSLKICTMFDKPSRRQVDIQADYVGYEIADKFIVGYGLDYDDRYRNLPYVGVLKPEIYSK